MASPSPPQHPGLSFRFRRPVSVLCLKLRTFLTQKESSNSVSKPSNFPLQLRENLATLLTSPCPLCTQDFASVSAGRIPSPEAVLAEIERTIVRKEAEGEIVRSADSADRPMANGRHHTWPTLWLTAHSRIETFLLRGSTWRLSKTMAALRVNINVKVYRLTFVFS